MSAGGVLTPDEEALAKAQRYQAEQERAAGRRFTAARKFWVSVEGDDSYGWADWCRDIASLSPVEVPLPEQVAS